MLIRDIVEEAQLEASAPLKPQNISKQLTDLSRSVSMTF